MTNNTVNDTQVVKYDNKKVLLWGWYGFENLGDDLLLKTMLQHLHGDITVPM